MIVSTVKILFKNNMSKRKVSSTTIGEITTLDESNKIFCREKSLCEKILCEFEPCAHVEDEKALQVFRNHALRTIDENTLQKLLKFNIKGLILQLV